MIGTAWRSLLLALARSTYSSLVSTVIGLMSNFSTHVTLSTSWAQLLIVSTFTTVHLSRFSRSVLPPNYVNFLLSTGLLVIGTACRNLLLALARSTYSSLVRTVIGLMSNFSTHVTLSTSWAQLLIVSTFTTVHLSRPALLDRWVNPSHWLYYGIKV